MKLVITEILHEPKNIYSSHIHNYEFNKVQRIEKFFQRSYLQNIAFFYLCEKRTRG